MFYILHGEDEFGRSEELDKLRAKLAAGDPAMASLNTSVFDGGRVTLSELRHACDTIPFMTDRRLVIVHGLLSRLAAGRGSKGSNTAEEDEPAWKRAFVKELAAYLPALPATTRLVFVEGEALPASHPILKLAKAEGEKQQAFVRLFPLPRDRDLVGWIRQRVREKGGQISPEASNLLATLVGPNPRLLDQELDKLLLYTGQEAIKISDVHTLVSQAREASIFDLMDSIGHRRVQDALQLLHRLLDAGEAPLYVLAMLARQVRILIQVSELRSRDLSEAEIATQLGLHPYVVKKALEQAHNFRMADLEAAHQKLVATDLALKTGRAEEELALDLLVVDLSSR